MRAHTLLVVDTDPEFCSFVRTTLESDGFSVLTASSGEEALQLLRNEKPDLVLLDLDLPGFSTIAFTKVLKQNPETSGMDIFVVSGRQDAEASALCLEAGAAEFLVKPIDTLDLTTRVWRSFHARMHHQTLDQQALLETPQRGVSLPDQSWRNRYGPYCLQGGLVGSDKMRKVFRAQHEKTGRMVSLKVLSENLSNNPQFIDSYYRILETLASLDEPGLLPAYDFGQDEGDYYWVSEWLEAGSMANLVRKRGRVPLPEALETVLQCTRILSTAASAGIFHWNLKPNSLLILEGGQVRIAEMCLAQAERAAAGVAEYSEYVGTSEFLAPEMARKDVEPDFRADIYSLGLIFIYMLRGMYVTPPFDLKPGREFPGSVIGILTRMTAADPAGRYSGYPQLIADLEEAQRNVELRTSIHFPEERNLARTPSLRCRNLFDLLAEVYASGTEGVAEVNLPGLKKRFFIKNREVVFYELVDQITIWGQLAEKSVIEPEQNPFLRQNFEHSLNELLSNTGLSGEVVRNVYRDVLRDAALNLLAFPSCPSDFFPAEVETAEFPTCRVSELLLSAARKLLPVQVITKELSRDCHLRRSTNYEALLSSLSLNNEEAFLAYRSDEPDISIDMLILLTNFPEELVFRLVYLLKKIKAIEVSLLAKPHPQTPSAAGSHAAAPPRQQQLSPPPSAPAPPAPARERTPSVTPPPRPAIEYVVSKPTPQPAAASAPQSPSPGTQKQAPKPPPTKDADPVKLASEAFQKALKYVEVEDWERAVYYCRESVKQANPKYLHMLAKVSSNIPGGQREAEEAYHKAIELTPSNAELHLELSRFYFQRGLYLRAKFHCMKVLKLVPNDVDAKKLRGEIESKKKGNGGCICERKT